MSCNNPESSSTIRIGPDSAARDVSISGGNAFANLGNLYDAHEKTNVPYRVSKFVVIHGLYDVIIATQLVTARHFAGVVRGGEHTDGDFSELGIGFELPQNVNAVHLGHANIQEQE